MDNQISLFWFRQDLRLSDNQGLFEAARLGKILPIYILDDSSPEEFKIGSASKIWLHHSLQKLNQSLDNQLNVYIGNPEKIVLQLVKDYSVNNVLWNRCYEPWNLSVEDKIKRQLTELNINYKFFNSSYLWRPEEILKDDATHYKVFSVYKKKVYLLPPRKPLPKPKKLSLIKDAHNRTTIETLKLIPSHRWQKKITEQWNFGEAAAQQKLENFINTQLSGYKKGRDFPGYAHTSKLSPHLHFGEISPYQIWEAVNTVGRFNAHEEDVNHFLNEMIWREFSCYLLFHFNKLATDNIQTKFNAFPWKHSAKLLKAWQTGKTGYPVIDAGMRELWQTGTMHNRVRMIVASFLVKNLLIHWHYGRDWFWDCLLDADLANNSASWQWVAGSGADAAPYFRIFNPITQGEKFDAEGIYTKTFLPELKDLPNKFLFKPWQASDKILKAANIILGKTYPNPIVDLKATRDRALAAYQSLKSPAKVRN